MVLVSKFGGGNLLHLISRGQPEKTAILVGDPQITLSVLGDTMHRPPGDARYGNETVILQVAELALCGNPNSSAFILKKGIRAESIETAVTFGAGCAGNRYLPLIPLVQATRGAEPNASILVRQYGHDVVTRQTLLHRERRSRKLTKAVEAIIGSYPNIGFMILKESENFIS